MPELRAQEPGAQACNADNAADLSEQNVVEMVTCIQLEATP